MHMHVSAHPHTQTEHHRLHGEKNNNINLVTKFHTNTHTKIMEDPHGNMLHLLITRAYYKNKACVCFTMSQAVPPIPGGGGGGGGDGDDDDDYDDRETKNNSTDKRCFHLVRTNAVV